VLQPLKKQNQNHLAERSWSTCSSIPNTFWCHTLCYASDLFNVLPICCHTLDGDVPTTPFQLFHGKWPCITSFRVFGSHVVVKCWVTETSKTGKQTERGTQGIFIGFPPNQKGYLIYCPGYAGLLRHPKLAKTGKQTERGTQGIFIGFPPNQKGYLIYCPGSRQILVSDDVLFDESLQAAIATTWQQYQDSLSLKPVSSFIPDIDTTLDHTGT